MIVTVSITLAENETVEDLSGTAEELSDKILKVVGGGEIGDRCDVSLVVPIPVEQGG